MSFDTAQYIFCALRVLQTVRLLFELRTSRFSVYPGHAAV